MAMLTADEALKLYPRGLWVFDATGRQLAHVMACNAETGEVIVWSQGTYSPLDWIRWRLRRVKPRLRWDWLHKGSIHTRHGFWPAPLRLEVRIGSAPAVRDCLVNAQGGPDKRLTLTQLDELIDAVEARL